MDEIRRVAAAGPLIRCVLGAAFLLGCYTSEPTTPGTPPDVSPDGGARLGAQSLKSAAEKFPDLRTLWSASIVRSCGPNNGVCHDSKQYPDLQTAGGFLDSVNAPCNQIRDDPTTVDNLCEPRGDTLQLGTWQTRIGTVTLDPPSKPTTIHLTTHDPIPQGTSGTAAAILRARKGVSAVSFPIADGVVRAPAAGSSVVDLDVAAMMAADTTQMGAVAPFLMPIKFSLGDSGQVEMGDPNGDGVFGADLGGALVKPGAPLQSYLFLRLAGPLPTGAGSQTTNVEGMPALEAQMPKANYQYWDIDNSLTALWCWISGLQADGTNADGPIDYSHCDLSTSPPITHPDEVAATYSSVYETILAPNCRSCHYTGTTQPTTLYFDDADSAYDILLGIRGSGPSEAPKVPFITPGDAPHSYLYQKVTGTAPTGARMPLGGSLSDAQINTIENWIFQGAHHS